MSKKKTDFVERVQLNKLMNEWVRFVSNPENTELWKKDKFERFLNNREIIIKREHILWDKKIIHTETYDGEINTSYEYILNRLQEIYNQRFNNVDTDIDLSEYLKTAPTKVLFMYELGIFDYLIERYPELKINQTLLCNVISVFSGMKTDTIRKPYAALLLGEKDTSDYNFKSEKNQNALNDVFKKLGLERNKKLKGG